MSSRRVSDVTLLAVAALAGGVLGVLLVVSPEPFVAERPGTGPAGTATVTEPAITEPRTPTEVDPPRLEVAVMELAEACQTGLFAACNSRRGVAVASVTEGGPADRARIRRGDVIVEVDGQPVESPDALVALVEAAGPGAELDVELRRFQVEGGAEVLGRARIAVRLPQQP